MDHGWHYVAAPRLYPFLPRFPRVCTRGYTPLPLRGRQKRNIKRCALGSKWIHNVIRLQSGIMKTRLVRIGNSQGIRIPKTLIEQSGLQDEVEVTMKGNSLIIRPASNPREGWAEAFEKMARSGGDALLDAEVVNDFDKAEWEW